MAPAPDFAFRGQEAGLCGGRAGGAGDRDGDRAANIAIGHGARLWVGSELERCADDGKPSPSEQQRQTATIRSPVSGSATSPWATAASPSCARRAWHRSAPRGEGQSAHRSKSAESLGSADGADQKTSLISLTSEERRTRPHIGETWGLPVDRAQAVAFSA